MRRLDTITGGPDRLRIGSWRGDPAIALLSPTPGLAPSPSGIERALDELRRRGYRSVLTPALTSPEQPPFVAAGFTVHERLHLLGPRPAARALSPASPGSASAGAATATSLTS